jgi:hypothetical protein
MGSNAAYETPPPDQLPKPASFPFYVLLELWKCRHIRDNRLLRTGHTHVFDSKGIVTVVKRALDLRLGQSMDKPTLVGPK